MKDWLILLPAILIVLLIALALSAGYAIRAAEESMNCHIDNTVVIKKCKC